MAAAQGGIDNDLLAHPGAFHALAHGRHDTDRIGAKNMRRLQASPGTAFAHPDVQMVQTGTEDLQDHLARTRPWLLDILHPHNVRTSVLVNHRRFHD